MSELRRDREWEHWPQERRPEERMRRRLLGLFHPTAGNPELEQALDAHTHEIELRAQELAETIADLERREARTNELRTAVEQMLRRGSAELDERHAELSTLAAQLAERENDVTHAEEAIAERRRALGAVELHRAAVERREETATAQEEELARREEALREREESLADLEAQARELAQRELQVTRRASDVEMLQNRIAETLAVVEREQGALAQREASVQERERLAAELDRREQALNASAGELRALEESLATDRTAIEQQRQELEQAVASVSRDLGMADLTPEQGASPAYVALVPGDRYRLVERDDGPPTVGLRILVEEDAFQIVRIGSSPLPGDRRRCAFLELDLAY